MALITIKAPNAELVGDIYKYLVVLTVFQLISSMADVKSFGLMGDPFNEDFLVFLLIVGLAFLGYHLVATDVIRFI